MKSLAKLFKREADPVSTVDAMFVLCAHYPGVRVTPAAGAVLKKHAKDALAKFDPSLGLNKDAYIRFGLGSTDDQALNRMNEMLDRLPAKDRKRIPHVGKSLVQMEGEAEANLPLEMKKLMQERELDPDAYELRSFKESPDPGVTFLWIAAIRKAAQVANEEVIMSSHSEDHERGETLKPSKPKTVTESAHAYFEQGAIYTEQGRLEEAVNEFKAAVRIKHDFAKAHHNLGSIYFEQGRLDEAIGAYEAAIRIQPNLAEAHLGLGLVFGKKGFVDKAMSEFQAALRIEPDYAEAHYNLGVMYIVKQRMDDAIGEFRDALRFKPDYVDALINLGAAHSAQGRPDDAVREYKTALEIKPDCAEAHYNLGVNYGSRGWHDIALNEFQAAVRIKPDYVAAQENLAVAYWQRGNREEAIDQWRIAAKLGSVQARNYLDQLGI